MRRRALAGMLAAVTAASALLVTTPAAADPAPAELAGATEQHQVTLITGHVVKAGKDQRGQWQITPEQTETAVPAMFSRFARHNGEFTDEYLMPRKVAHLVESGLLDRELFNITGLIRQRYDDANSKTLPLLVESPDGAAAGRASALAGARVERSLPEFGLAAVSTPKDQAARYWETVTGGQARTLAGGQSRIWLNDRVSASLDASVPQVGAPAAWQAGHTGKDVTVAVLDTGIDTDHPDLAGKVALSKDFSGKGTVQDGHGHGTHVASTVAGSGAVSGGRYKGVAPDAKLAVGKVLSDAGRGSTAEVLAGMQWAVTEAKAKVVNMSLGSRTSDGTDPLSQAVNTLTRKYGTLFVIAAGNTGRDQSVSAPGAADAALTVGSVTKSGQLSDFSSRGPRRNDGAAKPEIAAPGTSIVAARAKNTPPGWPSEHYTTMSGTSMATPHIAGAAAILAGQHPDWAADRLKGALVGTAKPVKDTGVFAVGAGLVDLARADSQPVQAGTGAVSTQLKWPDAKVEKRTVSYLNSGPAPVTLNLNLALTSTTGQAAPDRLARLSASSLTLPAGGKGSVELTMTPRSGQPGMYGGVLTASTVDSTVQIRTPVSVNEEPEKYDLTVKVRDRDEWRPGMQADVQVINLDTGESVFGVPGERLRLPAGRYGVESFVSTPFDDGGPQSLTMLAHPQLRLGKNTTIELDASKAKQVSASTDQPAARGGYWATQFLFKPKRFDLPVSSLVHSKARFTTIYAHSTPGVTGPDFSYTNNFRLEDAAIELFAEQPRRLEVDARWLSGSARPAGTEKLTAVHGGQGRPQDLAGIQAGGKLVVLDLPGDVTWEEAVQRVSNVRDVGGKLVGLGLLTPQLTAAATSRADPAVALPSLVLDGHSGAQFSQLVKAGGVQTSLTTRNTVSHRYELSFVHEGRVPDRVDYRVKSADLAAVHSSYYGYSPELPPYVDASTNHLGMYLHPFAHSWASGPPQRVEYFTPNTWNLTVDLFTSHNGSLNRTITLEGGKSYRLDWNKAVAGPSFTGTTSNQLGNDHPWVWQTRDLLDVTVPLFSDAGGQHRVSSYKSTVTGSTSLYRDGNLVATQDRPARGVFVLDRSIAQYRLTTEAVRNDLDGLPLSTKVSGDWTFRRFFQPGPNGAWPLLAVRYAPPVDIRNRAPGSTEFSIPITVPRQDGPATITSLEVEVSFDDGATWKPAAVSGGAGQWSAAVTHPASGFASLRAKASDSDGNSVEQTVIRAYQIG